MPSPSELERLYDEHAQSLFAFLLSTTRNLPDTRDILQDVFSKLAGDPDILHRVRNERAFLIRMAHNALIDLYRRNEARQRNHEKLEQEKVDLFAVTDTPDAETFRSQLNLALAELPPDQRAVVHLKLWEGMTFDAIANSLQISPNTAASRYRYGIDKLRTILRPLYEEIL